MTLAESLELVGLGELEADLERAARSVAPILIIGAAGTGRSWLARSLHRASNRSEAPLVEVDPLVVPSELFDSELFGHRKGAFTGAVADRPGKVAQAEGGSLLLDRLEEISSLAQAKLLRLVAERQYAPVGGSDRYADVRFLSIASPDVYDRVRRGVLRRDLFYRLEVLVFQIPRLSKRTLDWSRLGRALIAEACSRYGIDQPPIDDTELAALSGADWPGNLTQLRTHLERALLSHEGRRALDLSVDSRAPVPRSLKQVEREAILDALAYCRGSQTQAAKLLGISRKSLWERRKRLDIP